MEIDIINNPLAVIESPLSGDFIRNKRYVTICCQYCLLELKMIPYASHLFFPLFLDANNYHQIVKYHTLPESYMKFLYSSKSIGTPTKGVI